MHRANHLTVVHHDDTHTDFDDVWYGLTADALRVLDAAGTEITLPAHDVLTTHATVIRDREEAR
jgi:hypothetical protein